MADYINDKELDEINEIYRQKVEAQKSKKSSKKSKADKKADDIKNTEKAKKSVKAEEIAKEKAAVSEKKTVAAQVKYAEKKAGAASDRKTENKSEKKSEKSAAPKPSKKEKTPESKETALGYKINIGVCALFFAVVAVCLLVLERPTISESEKRELAKFPEFSWSEYWNGDYTADISNFFNDTVPFRDQLKQLGANFRSLFGFSINGATLSGDITILDSNPSQTEVTTQSTKPIVIVTPAPSQNNSDAPSPDSSDNADGSDNSSDAPAPEPSDTPDESETPESTPEPDDVPVSGFITPSDPDLEIEFQQGNQVVYRSNGTLYAGALYNGKREYAEDYADSLNALKTQLGDINVYSMTALTQNTFITPVELAMGLYTEQADSMYLRNMINSNIKVLDMLSILSPHADEDIFFLRDSHWTQLGAYYAAEALAKAAGVDFADISRYEKGEKDCLGSVYTYTKYEGLMYEGETFTYYIPPNEYRTDYYDADFEFQFNYPLMPLMDYNEKAFYSLFMVADTYIKHITTDNDNDRVLVMIKDDYPSAMVPWLTSSFEEIYAIDIRYCNFNVADFCKEVGATDVFVGMTTQNALGEIGTYLDRSMSQ